MVRARRSSSFPIAIGVLAVALSIGLLVGWILVIVQNLYLTQESALNAVLLSLGSASFVVIITVLVLFSVFLVREIRMTNRQIRFTDSITHELKSPLASLRLCLETLQRPDLTPDQRLGVREMMKGDVERLSILIDDVLEASRLSHPMEGHPLEEVALGELVQGCAEVILRYYKQPTGSIRLDIPDDIVFATDRFALETVFKNLLDNAIKYSQGGERPVVVTVEARIKAHALHVEIRDQGVGIPKRYQRRIFERFFRVPHETVLAQHGTGLGLFVVSSLVGILGGKLKVASEGLNCGTVMRFWIPLKNRQKTRGGGARKVMSSEKVESHS